MTRQAPPTRRGAVLAVTLVCLLVTTSLVTTMLSGTLKLRRQMLVERDARQAELLVAAGVDRAVYRLTTDDAYEGERWEPALLDEDSAAVEIELKTLDESRLRVEVVARYTANRRHPVRRSQTFFVASKRTPDEE